ncbi:MAG: hypothetical protein R6U44_07630 [Archaeoglobaceae archaeon]
MALFRKNREKVEMSNRILHIKLDNVAELLIYHRDKMFSPFAKEKDVNAAVRSVERLLNDSEYTFSEENARKMNILAKELKRFSMIKLGDMDKYTFDLRIKWMLKLIEDIKESTM